LGHDKIRSEADLRGGSHISFNHVIDPHFVTFSRSLFRRSATLNLTLTLLRSLIRRCTNCRRSDPPRISTPLRTLSRAGYLIFLAKVYLLLQRKQNEAVRVEFHPSSTHAAFRHKGNREEVVRVETKFLGEKVSQTNRSIEEWRA